MERMEEEGKGNGKGRMVERMSELNGKKRQQNCPCPTVGHPVLSHALSQHVNAMPCSSCPTNHLPILAACLSKPPPVEMPKCQTTTTNVKPNQKSREK